MASKFGVAPGARGEHMIMAPAWTSIRRRRLSHFRSLFLAGSIVRPHHPLPEDGMNYNAVI